MQGTQRGAKILELQDRAGILFTNPDSIAPMIVSHFQEAFTAEPLQATNNILQHIPHLVSTAQNIKLCSLPEESMIYQVVCGLNKDSAAGLDVFSGFCFQSCWTIVSVDIIEVVQHFFRIGYRWSPQMDFAIYYPQGASLKHLLCVFFIHDQFAQGQFLLDEQESLRYKSDAY